VVSCIHPGARCGAFNFHTAVEKRLQLFACRGFCGNLVESSGPSTQQLEQAARRLSLTLSAGLRCTHFLFLCSLACPQVAGSASLTTTQTSSLHHIRRQNLSLALSRSRLPGRTPVQTLSDKTWLCCTPTKHWAAAQAKVCSSYVGFNICCAAAELSLRQAAVLSHTPGADLARCFAGCHAASRRVQATHGHMSCVAR
jgi:hypothetical protein